MSEIRVDTISEKTSANGVAIDSVTLKDGGIAATAASTITVADNSDTLTLSSTDADANNGPKFVLNRDSGSPADGDNCGIIKFKADDDGGNSTELVNISAAFTDVSNGSEDATFNISSVIGGSQMGRIGMSPTETVFNDDSGDIDFRVESNGQANMLFVDGGNNRVHINGTTGTREFNVSGDNTRLLLYSTNNSTGAGQLQFGDADDEQIGRIMYEHDGNKMTFHTAATERMRIHGGGEISTGGETAPDVTPGAICLNQAASDQAILTFKSSDVAHGMTVVAETDTFVSMLKNSDGGGALNLTTLSETATAFRHVACATGSNTAESLAATSVWGVDTRLKDGSSVTGPGADDNIASFRTSDQAQVIFKGDGEIFSNQSATVGTYDAYEDAQLIRAYDLSHMKGVIDSKFDKFVQYNKDDLQKARLIGTDDDGNATSFVNWTGMSRLHNGAIWQQYEKHQKLASAFYKLAEKTIGKEEADKLLTEEEIQLLN